MSAKKTIAATAKGNSQPGHLAKLKPLHLDYELPIRILNACQVRHKHADPATVAKYRELLVESEPPPIVVVLDGQGRHYIADGHNRTAAALAAGRTVIRANVYAGAASDAKLIGLECNQHGLGLTLAEKKAALDDILDANGHGFTDSALARMTGLDRHTIEKRRRERESGDFINAAGRMRHLKTPEELIFQAASSFARQAERHGADVVLKALELLPPHVREDVMRKIGGV